ncbi:hypothetical protein EI94DRAFT_1707309 [Lactarius quietus]|nr:hypothetical protein EI94DRAFT_1707309 [Lactarius quietus]
MEADAILHEMEPLSMDVDNTLWIDKPDIPTQRRVSQLGQCARAAWLLRLSGGASTAFRLLCSARSVAKAPTSSFPFTEFRSGQENISFLHGCERLSQEGCDEEECQDGSCDEYDVAAELSFGSSKPGRYNKEGCPVITVVDRSGIHDIGVSWCQCSGAPEHDMQLMMAGLFPATFNNPKTAFTFRVLEDFHLDNLECKTTPSQFFSCLRRLTNDKFPNTVPWRALISQKRFGFGYEQNEEAKPRSMAVFCALCAQLGINLPEDWREYKNSKVLFMRGFMMDGNFQAEHMKMRNLENDVPLSDGTGFMLRGGRELIPKKTSTCHDHRAVNNVNKHGGHLESTGIGATACIHGAFVPDSVVNFQKGEVQKNMDYSIFKALNFNMEGIETALISYDVMCQWSVHMMDRVNSSHYLKLPDSLELRLAIGLFHIHGHKDTCLARYSPSFIKGGRQIDSETIETLWALLNEITRSTRGMSTSHRWEVIDDHMNDSNWKKLIDLGKFSPNDTTSMLKWALSGATMNVAAFDSIDASASPASVRVWTAKEESVQWERGRNVKAMDIYDIKMKQPWIGSGLKLQEVQLSLQALVRKIGSLPTPDQQRDLTLRRARLQERVDTFQRQAATIFRAAGDTFDSTLVRETYFGTEFDGIDDEDDGNGDSPAEEHDPTQGTVNCSTDDSVDAEYIPLHLPSHFGCNWCSLNAAEDLAEAEIRLREGQLNDSLHQIRIALGYKSYLFRHDVRPAHTQKTKTCAWAGVHAVESTVQHHVWVYARVQKSMVDLDAGTNLLDRYKVLRRQDLCVNTSILAPHIRGQQNKSLAWFWTMDVRQDTDVGEWMEDFYQVHWLRAKAQKMQWIEELQCLQVEMESAVRLFRHQEQVWHKKEAVINSFTQPGHAAWAARQCAMWRSMAIQAESKFSTLLKNDPPPDFAKVFRPR